MGSLSKGSNTTTQTQSPNPAAMDAYIQLLQRAQGVANNPYVAYTGELTAPINAQQQAGIGNINQYASAAQPSFYTAQNMVQGAAQPLTASQIQNYQNPFTQQVINATEAQFNNQNAQQQQQVLGNASLQGALGGDRTAVAQANLAGQQQLAQAPVIAGLYAQGYGQAAQMAAQQYQQNPAAMAGLYANLGLGAQTAGLQGGSAQLGAGTQEQQTQALLDQLQLQQFNQQQAFPYAQTGWLAGVTGGLGSQMGGTSTTTGPAPNPFTQLAGLGVAGLGAYGGAGGFKPSGQARGGRIQGFDAGGAAPSMPYGGNGGPLYGGVGWMPSVNIPHGRLPSPPSLPQQNQQIPGLGGAQSGVAGLGKMLGAPGSSSAAAGNTVPEDAFVGPTQAMAWPEAADLGTGAMAGLGEAGAGEGLAELAPLLLLAKRGGRIRGFADGGVPVQAGLGTGSLVPTYDDPSLYAPGPLAYAPPGEVYAPDINLNGDRLGLGQSFTPDNAALRADAGYGSQGLDAINRAAPVREPAGDVSPMAYTDEPTGGLGAPAPSPEARQRQGGFGLGQVSNPVWQGMMAAGLGMMASRSPFLGVGIGEGGLAGLSQYGTAKQQELVAAREGRMADALKKQSEQHEKAAKETERFHRATEAFHQEQLQLGTWKPWTDEFGRSLGFFNAKTGETRTNDEIRAGKKPPVPGTPPSTATPTPDVQANVPPTKVQIASLGEVPAFSKFAEQPYDYSKGAPEGIQKGYELPAPTAIGELSPATIRAGAESYLQTGKVPSLKSVGRSPGAVNQNRAFQTAVMNYGNALAASRGTTPEELAESWRTAPYLGRFIMGPDGRATVSLGTAVRHLDSLQQLGKAWQEAADTGNFQKLNQLKAFLARQWGDANVTNLESASKIIGAEIIKALGVAGAGSEGERAHAAEAFSAIQSPDQLSGAIKTVQGLLGGQLEGKEGQARAIGIPEQKFRQLIGERPYEILKSLSKPESGTVTPPSPAARPAAPQLPTGVPAGSLYSPSLKMWKAPDGTLFDATGKRAVSASGVGAG